jgi:hypothetical protein
MLARLVPFAVVCVVATARAVLSQAPPRPGLGDDDLKQDAFTSMRAHEQERRRNAAEAFPTDPWSQSDAFHALEAEGAQSFADKRHVSLTAVLAAIDDGMRAARARGDQTMIGSVPPCHPRVIY